MRNIPTYYALYFIAYMVIGIFLLNWLMCPSKITRKKRVEIGKTYGHKYYYKNCTKVGKLKEPREDWWPIYYEIYKNIDGEYFAINGSNKLIIIEEENLKNWIN